MDGCQFGCVGHGDSSVGDARPTDDVQRRLWRWRFGRRRCWRGVIKVRAIDLALSHSLLEANARVLDRPCHSRVCFQSQLNCLGGGILWR